MTLSFTAGATNSTTESPVTQKNQFLFPHLNYPPSCSTDKPPTLLLELYRLLCRTPQKATILSQARIFSMEDCVQSFLLWQQLLFHHTHTKIVWILWKGKCNKQWKFNAFAPGVCNEGRDPGQPGAFSSPTKTYSLVLPKYHYSWFVRVTLNTYSKNN